MIWYINRKQSTRIRHKPHNAQGELGESGLNLDELLSSIEKKWLIAALEKSNGKKTKAAEYLHMSFRSFRYRLAKYGMDTDT